MMRAVKTAALGMIAGIVAATAAHAGDSPPPPLSVVIYTADTKEMTGKQDFTFKPVAEGDWMTSYRAYAAVAHVSQGHYDTLAVTLGVKRILEDRAEATKALHKMGFGGTSPEEVPSTALYPMKFSGESGVKYEWKAEPQVSMKSVHIEHKTLAKLAHQDSNARRVLLASIGRGLR